MACTAIYSSHNSDVRKNGGLSLDCWSTEEVRYGHVSAYVLYREAISCYWWMIRADWMLFLCLIQWHKQLHSIPMVLSIYSVKPSHVYQKFIHWATKGRLNNHCNNKGLLGMKQRRTATGFLCISGIQAVSATFNFTAIFYMAVFAIEWQIDQYFKQPDTTNWDQVMDHFLKACKEFAWFLSLVLWSLYSRRVLAIIPL